MRLLLIALALLLAIASSRSIAANRDDARALILTALKAQGGEERLRSVRAVRLKALKVTNALEQSVRPEGPWFENYTDFTETRRFEPASLLVEGRSRGFMSPWFRQASWVTSTNLVQQGAAFSIVEGKARPDRQALVAPGEESLALGPERALLTALDAPDVHVEPDQRIHGYPHRTVGFTWSGVPVRLFLLPQSKLPIAVEILRSRSLDMLFAPWGDVITRVEWDAWTLEPNGLHYPRRWATFVNDQLFESRMIDEVEFNPPNLADYTITPEQVEAAKQHSEVRPLAKFTAPAPVQVAPGIRLYQGAWNVATIDIKGGTYVLEAPISSSFSQGVIDLVRRSGRQLLGVITTSDSWPHIGGIREYVAEKIPVTALDLNAPILRRLILAPYKTEPDSLARRPVEPQLQLVDASMMLGEGAQRMRLIPFRTATGERQMAIYWPAYQLLYTSDIMSPQGEAIWLPQYRSEVAELIAREKLDVARVFGMHYPPMAWTELQKLPAVAQ